jgi:transposase-like protein
MKNRRGKMMTVQEFRRLFGTERGCGAQLTRQRWPEGFQCPRCAGSSRGYIASRRVHECAGCGYQCSVTAGTIFHKTRTPLSSWFWAIYRMSHDKKGISAMQLSKEIGVSYPTAWLIEHKIRKAMEDRDRHYTLRGLVELDEGYVGGEEHGEPRKGRGARNKAVVAVAVEHSAAGQPGRPPVPGYAALSVLANAGSSSLDGFLRAKVEPGSHVLTDGWNGYWHVGDGRQLEVPVNDKQNSRSNDN